MRLRPDQLPAQLQKHLLPVYLVSGDELLIAQECCDLIRNHCRAQDILEREVLEVDRHFDWNRLLESANSLSLFAERRLLELRLGNSKMDQKSSAILQEYLERSDDSTILLISAGRMDKRSLGAKWVKAIEERGALIQVWPVERRQLGQWLSQRMADRGMKADSAALELLADRVEGNLLAASQEVEKLRILVGERLITAEIVEAAVGSSARYDVFKLIDAALAGDAAYALQMYQGLRAEGGEEIAMLGAISRELRNLYSCAMAVEKGHGIDRVLEQARVWDKRKMLYKRCLNRLSPNALAALLQLAARTDPALKGQSDDHSTTLMTELIARLSGPAIVAAVTS